MSKKLWGFSIGIIFHNEGPNILPCLRGLKKAITNFKSLSSEPVELIFVDNCSQKECRQLILDFCAEFELTHQLIGNDVNNMGRARNRFILAAAHPKLIFLDADCAPGNDWLIHFAKAFQENDSKMVGAMGGENIPPIANIEIFFECYRLLKANPLLYLGSTQLLPAKESVRVRHVPTCNVLYKKEALLSVGGFCEDFARAGEDLDLNTRLIRSGWKIFFQKGLQVEHHDKTKLSLWFAKVFRYGSAQPPILFSYPRSVDFSRWLPFFLLLILSTMFFVAGLKAGAALVIAALLIPVGLCGLRGKWLILPYWTVFLNGTIASYLLGYVIGTCRIVLRPLRRKNAIPKVAVERTNP